MAAPELGLKRVCVSCGTKFYDLTKSPAICPKCGTEQPADVPRPRRAGGNVVEDKRKKPVPVAEEPDLEGVEVEAAEEEEAEEDVLEDTGDLEDDDAAIVPDLEPDTDEPER